ncbi:MAG: MCE family protein, partial [Deltaproteobacteria bacterium]|nr:MCE family protein [Deltaproteobacteria bacterium]
MGDRAIEVKVGLLLLVAMVLLGGFLLVMSGLRLEKSYTVYVDFNNPGGVQSGAPVKIAGERVGTVKSATYLGGRLDPRTGKRKLVRLEVAIDERVRETVHDDAIFYVATQGVLGEQYVAIDPGTWEIREANGRTRPRALLRDGAIVEGVDPPRLDLALALGYELLETMTRTLRENRQLLSQLLDDTASMLRSISGLLRDNRGRFDQIIANIDSLITELDTTVRHTRERVIDSPHTTRILSSLDHTLRDVRREIGPLMRQGRETISDVDQVIGETLGPEQRGQIRETLTDVRSLARNADRAT